MSRYKEQTCTSKVEDYLRGLDDFANQRQIVQATGCNSNQVSAAVFELRKYRVIDVVIEADGVGWWYALSKDNDQRSKTVRERTPETNPRKQRQPHSRKKGVPT